MADPVDPVDSDDRPDSRVAASRADGGESYPLESHGADAPLGADPPPPHPPCPACGAPRRLAEPVCLQCGHGQRPAAPAHDDPEDPDDSKAEPPRDGETSAIPDPDDGTPLVRSWPGGGRVPWILGGIVLLALFVFALTGTTAFPPAMLEGGQSLGPLVHLALAVRVVAAAAFWSLAAWGAGLVFARTRGRPVGGRVELGGRMLLVASFSRLAILLPIAEPLPAFLIEGLLALLLLAAGLWAALRISWLHAGGLAGVTAFIVGSAALMAHVVAWVLA